MHCPSQLPAFVFLASCQLLAHPQSGSINAVPGRSVVFGANQQSYILTAPSGWVFDEQANTPGPARGAFRPSKGSPERSAFAYTRFVAGVANAAEFMNSELAQFRSKNPQVTVEVRPDLKTMWGMRVTICSFQGDLQGHSGWMADIEAPKGIIQIVAITRDQSDSTLAETFAELVKSCAWLKVKLPSTR